MVLSFVVFFVFGVVHYYSLLGYLLFRRFAVFKHVLFVIRWVLLAVHFLLRVARLSAVAGADGADGGPVQRGATVPRLESRRAGPRQHPGGVLLAEPVTAPGRSPTGELMREEEEAEEEEEKNKGEEEEEDEDSNRDGRGGGRLGRTYLLLGSVI